MQSQAGVVLLMGWGVFLLKKGGGRKGPEILCFGFSGRGMWGFSLLKRNEDRYYEWI